MYFTNLRNFGFWGFSHDREYNIKYLCNIYAAGMNNSFILSGIILLKTVVKLIYEYKK